MYCLELFPKEALGCPGLVQERERGTLGHHRNDLRNQYVKVSSRHIVDTEQVV